jgi:hypothetical protein
MVEGICKSFLQLFLVGMDGLSMNFAIQRLVPMEANQTLSEYNKLNATKVRAMAQIHARSMLACACAMRYATGCVLFCGRGSIACRRSFFAQLCCSAASLT